MDIISELSSNPYVRLPARLRERIKVAILDTGVDVKNDPIIRGAVNGKRIVKLQSWVGKPEDYGDTHGHGTHVARMFLEVAPSAEIFIAKIADAKEIPASELYRIPEVSHPFSIFVVIKCRDFSQAIDWAIAQGVHIISMSFGLEERNLLIDRAIDKAFRADKLIFAAASNNGGNKGRSHPAAKSQKVMCIHASDGLGTAGSINPTPKANVNNFMTLGIAIESSWKGQEVWKSGTSFATPVAAGIAANVMEFARYNCSLTEEEQQRLYSLEGLQAVFESIAHTRNGYQYIRFGNLWDGPDGNEKGSDEAAIRRIETAIRS